MARTTSRPTPTATRTLQPLGRHCPLCGETMWAAYHNYRTSTTLEEVVHLTLQIRRCLNRTSYHLSTPICHIFTPSARPAHDESGWHHSMCDDATWPSGYAAVDRQCCVRPGHAAVPSPATPHRRC